jgi:hypothetical protein
LQNNCALPTYGAVAAVRRDREKTLKNRRSKERDLRYPLQDGNDGEDAAATGQHLRAHDTKSVSWIPTYPLTPTLSPRERV